MMNPRYFPHADAVLFEGTDVPIKDDALLRADQEDFVELDEWKTYYLNFYGKVPEDFNGKPFKRLPGNQFEINFRNFVGYSKILNSDIRVRSLKIGESAYDQMLNEIADQYASLIFSFNTPTGAGFEKRSQGTDHTYVEFMFARHFLLNRAPNIDAIMGLILSNTHHLLAEENALVDIGSAHNLSPKDVAMTVANPVNYGRLTAAHQLTSTTLAKSLHKLTGRSLYLARVCQAKKYVTHNTMENRFVKFFISKLVANIEKVLQLDSGSKGTFLNPTFSKDAVIISQKLSRFLAAPLWQEVGEIRSIPESSTVLHGRSGYCDLFQLYSLLQRATRYQSLDRDIRQLIETKDLPLLYEYWCLFITLEAIKNELGSPVDINELTEMGSLEQQVPHGLRVSFRDGVDFYFNQRCSIHASSAHKSYSHPFRPDFMVSKGGKKIILDAKAKGEKGGFCGEEKNGEIHGYKDEDIDKMHTYREAINDVYGAYILYPGKVTRFFQSPDNETEYEGVGAIAIKPGEWQPSVEAIQKLVAAFLVA